MTRDEAVEEVRQLLGNRPDISATFIISQMKHEQTLLEQRNALPWFLKSEVASISTTIGEERVAVPIDFIKEAEEFGLYIFDGTLDEDAQWAELAKRDWSDMIKNFPSSGKPKEYDLIENYFRLRPVPDAAYTLKMIYYQHAAVLDTNIENRWLKHIPNLLIARTALSVGGGRLVNPRLLENANRIVQEQERALDNSIVAREEENRVRTMGGPN